MKPGPLDGRAKPPPPFDRAAVRRSPVARPADGSASVAVLSGGRAPSSGSSSSLEPSSSSSSSSSASASPNDSIQGDSGAEQEEDGFPRAMLGQRLLRQTAVGKSGEEQRGLKVRCLDPARCKCYKYRSVRLDTSVFGQQAAVHYLGVRLLEAHAEHLQEGRTHFNWKPKKVGCIGFQRHVWLVVFAPL